MVINNDTTEYKNLLSILPHKKIGEKIVDDRHSIRGIWQRYHVQGHVRSRKLKFYKPYNPQSLDQQAQRARYKAGFEAWRALTDAEKEVYNQRAVGKIYSGYNLYMKENIHG